MLIVVRGFPRTGKTTLVKKLIQEAGSFEGFYTEEVLQNGNRIGFDVVTCDGNRYPLARTGSGRPRVGKYLVFLDRFNELCQKMIQELKDSPGLLVIDEVGKMELMSESFHQLLEKIATFNQKTVLLTAGKTIKHRLIERADKLIELTRENREAVLAELIDLIFNRGT